MMFAKYRYANLSLLNKALLPYLLLLLFLALAASFSSSFFLEKRLAEVNETRIKEIQEKVYQEFKELEKILDAQAIEVKNLLPATSTEIERLLTSKDRHTTATLSSPDNPQLPEQLKALSSKIQSDKSSYITVVQGQHQSYSLIAGLLLDPTHYLFLSHPLDRTFLDELAKRYQSDFIILNKQGELISSNRSGSASFTPLNDRQLATLQATAPAALPGSDGEIRLISYSPLPLGHEGTFLLGTAQSLKETEATLFNYHRQLFIIICLGLLVCLTLVRSLLHALLNPLNPLLKTCTLVIAGDRTARVEIDKNHRSDLSTLGAGYNQLLDLLDEKDQQLEVLSERLQKMTDLKSHNQHLRKTNLNLETRAVSLKDQNQKFSALFQITQTMVSSLDQRLLHERIIQALKDSLNCTICVLYIFHPGAERLVAVKVQGLYAVDLKAINIELGKGVAGEAALKQSISHIPDLSASEEKPQYGNEIIRTGSLLAVPLTVQNRLIGVINLHQSSNETFSTTDKQIAQAIANQAAIAIENARLYEKTKTLSATDELTGLSNRRQFQEYLLRELAQSRRHQNAFSILMIDIDNFKLYNDYHGHLKGDIVLKRVASSLLQNTRGVDLVARFGGEEFVLLLPKSDKQSSLAVAEKLRMCIEKELFPGAELSQPGQRLTISVGISHFPGDSLDVYDLMNLADTALYEAKKEGRNKCVAWHASLTPAEQ